jgi:hypothetical protein
LVNRSFLVQNGAIEMRFPTSDGAFHLLELVLGGFIDVVQLLKQTIKKKNRGPPTFFQLLSWLSRACLDKSSSITAKRARKKKERKSGVVFASHLRRPRQHDSLRVFRGNIDRDLQPAGKEFFPF